MNDDSNNQNGVVLGNVTNNVPEQNSNPTTSENVEVLSTENNVSNQNADLENSQVMTGANNNGTSQVMTGNESIDNQQTPNTSTTNQINQGVEQNVASQTPLSYTNPQTIMPNPVPSFENSNQIGQTPPLSLEPEGKPKKKKGKFFVVLLVLLLLGGLGFGVYYILNYTDLLTQKEKVTIKTKNLQINVGESLSNNIADYASITGTDSANCYKDTTSVDVTKSGNYKFTVTCGKISKEGKVTVVDNSTLNLDTKTVYKTKGATLSASEFSTNEEYNYEFVNSEDQNITSNEPGTYTIKLKVTKGDKSGETDAKVVILSHELKGYVACTSDEENIDGSNNIKMNKTEKIGILEDGQNGFAGFGQEIYTFIFDDDTDYKDYESKYKAGNTITINNVTGITNFGTDSNGKSIIMITKDRDNSSIIEEYGEDNVKNFSAIMKYFGTEGYKCAFEKAE